jgi:hypothetical protein
MDFNALKTQLPLMLLWVIKMWISLKRGETESKIIFLVKEHRKTATLKYDQLFGPELVRIEHYNHSKL